MLMARGHDPAPLLAAGEQRVADPTPAPLGMHLAVAPVVPLAVVRIGPLDARVGDRPVIDRGDQHVLVRVGVGGALDLETQHLPRPDAGRAIRAARRVRDLDEVVEVLWPSVGPESEPLDRGKRGHVRLNHRSIPVA